jgi:hypothetical protein
LTRGGASGSVGVMKQFLFAIGFLGTALSWGYFALADAPVPAPMSAIAVNASRCHLPPVIIVVYANGTHKTYTKDEVTPELLARLRKLPEANIATLMVPCADAPVASSTRALVHPEACGEDWAARNERLNDMTHCSRI